MPEFSMKIDKVVQLPEERSGIMTIVVMRPYAHLEKELRSAFKGEENVKVVLDRRLEERRKRPQAVAEERRRADRRRPKEELVEVVISA